VRKAMTVSATMLAVLALALPAQAKVQGTAYISGPGAGGGEGGGGPITMDGSDGGGYPVLSGLLDPGRSRTGRPERDLGPRYHVRYVIDEPPNQPAIIQHLYPFAEGGPVIYMLPDQEFLGSAGGTATGGWFRPDPELITELQDRGFPETSPLAVDAPAVTNAARTPATGPSPLVGVAVLLAGLVVAAMVFGRRRAAARAVRDPA
jgi:hypothetical protein